jgi:hypothetical protein
MSELIAETVEAAASAPETGKMKATSGARKPGVAKAAGRSSKKASPAKKAPKTAKKATSEAQGRARGESQEREGRTRRKSVGA